MDMITGGWDARTLRERAAPVSYAPPRRLPRWVDLRWIAGGATALMLTAFAFVPGVEGETPRAAAAPAEGAGWPQSDDGLGFADLSDIAFDVRVEEGRSFAASLARAGVRKDEAKEAARMVARALEMEPEEGTKVDILLGGATADGTRPLKQLSLVERGWRVSVAEAVNGGFTVSRHRLPPPSEGTQRLTGIAGDGLYFAIREAGVGPGAARDYLMALASRIDVGTLAPQDKFDLVLEPAGDRSILVYAALKRGDGTEFELARLGLGQKTRWIDEEGRDGRESTLSWPSNARVSSSYGMRFHPILHTSRMHSGIDFAAGYGSPILAAADGIVSSAGRAGGHGNRVMLMHEGGLETGYSHMSRIAVSPGATVRRGEVIGYVGSTGLSTGAHLHYEVHVGGRAVDPRNVGGIRSRPIGGDALEKVRARIAAYQNLAPTSA